jgi:predicted house-cleaning noncanonical NTP pyrophosphatase (MazG superfamily)
VSRDELEPMLKVKVLEEAFELLAESRREGTIEELADLLEVILGLAELNEMNLRTLLERAAEKAEKGRFREGLVLLETATPTLRDSLAMRDAEAHARSPRGGPMEFREALVQSRTPTVRDGEVVIPLVPPPDLWGVRRRFTIRLDQGTELSISYNGDTARLSINESSAPVVHPEQLSLYAEAADD